MNAATIDRACTLFLKGWTVRALETSLGIARSTIHYHLKKKLGSRPSQSRRQGSLLIIEEHLSSPRLSKRQKFEVRRWMTANAAKIREIDQAHDISFLTYKAEAELTRQECGHRSDFRANLSVISGGGHAA